MIEVNADTETASKIIEEVNNTETDSNFIVNTSLLIYPKKIHKKIR